MGQVVITPESRTEPFLELSRTRKGRLFKKHILSVGPLYANGTKIDIDDDFMNTVVKNFHDKRCDIVQVPIVDKANRHSEDPRDNIGEVVDLKFEDGKLYSFIDSRKEDASVELGNTLIGASASFSTNYKDTDTDTLVGPTLLHVAITNRPHVLNLEDFEEVIAMSAETGDEVIMLSERSNSPEAENNELEETQNMKTKEELLELLKAEYSIDVEALEAAAVEAEAAKTAAAEENATLKAENATLEAEKVEAEELAVKLSNSIKESLKSDVILQLSADDSVDSQVETLISVVADAGVKLTSQGSEIVDLSNRIETLETDKKHTAAANVVNELISAGRILPVNKDAMIELRLSNEELFDKIVPETPVVELSQENGTGETPEGNEINVQEEVSRILNV